MRYRRDKEWVQVFSGESHVWSGEPEDQCVAIALEGGRYVATLDPYRGDAATLLGRLRLARRLGVLSRREFCAARSLVRYADRHWECPS